MSHYPQPNVVAQLEAELDVLRAEKLDAFQKAFQKALPNTTLVVQNGDAVRLFEEFRARTESRHIQLMAQAYVELQAHNNEYYYLTPISFLNLLEKFLEDHGVDAKELTPLGRNNTSFVEKNP